MIENASQLTVGIAHCREARGYAGDGVNGFIHGMLDVVDLRTDITGCFGGLLRQRLDLGCDDGEAAARSTGTRCFNRCV